MEFLSQSFHVQSIKIRVVSSVQNYQKHTCGLNACAIGTTIVAHSANMMKRVESDAEAHFLLCPRCSARLTLHHCAVSGGSGQHSQLFHWTVLPIGCCICQNLRDLVTVPLSTNRVWTQVANLFGCCNWQATHVFDVATLLLWLLTWWPFAFALVAFLPDPFVIFLLHSFVFPGFCFSHKFGPANETMNNQRQLARSSAHNRHRCHPMRRRSWQRCWWSS